MALIALCAALTGAGLASAQISQKGTLQVNVDGKLRPKRLPRTGTAPISVSVGGVISTTDQSLAPQLKRIRIELNRHGRLDAKGLPNCNYHRIQPGSSSHALKACRASLVGKGSFSAAITLAGQEPYPTEGKLLVFNSVRKGKPVLYGHIYAPRPFASSFVIVFKLSKHRKGTYGTVLNAPLPKAMDSWGRLTGLKMTLARRYRFKGKRHSYLSSGCPAPKGFGGAGLPPRPHLLCLRRGPQAQLGARRGLQGAGVGEGSLRSGSPAASAAVPASTLSLCSSLKQRHGRDVAGRCAWRSRRHGPCRPRRRPRPRRADPEGRRLCALRRGHLADGVAARRAGADRGAGRGQDQGPARSRSSRPAQDQDRAEPRLGRLDTRGLPKCRRRRIASAGSAEALAACGDALVGAGGIVARSSFAGQSKSTLRGELLFFNAVSRGRPLILAHLSQSNPPTIDLIDFHIRRTRGTFGTAITARLSRSVNRNGYLKSIFLRLQRTYSFHGRRRAYLSAGCAAPRGFPGAVFPFARASMTFDDGRTLSSTLVRSCKVRR